jgi:hypothetical protein
MNLLNAGAKWAAIALVWGGATGCTFLETVHGVGSAAPDRQAPRVAGAEEAQKPPQPLPGVGRKAEKVPVPTAKPELVAKAAAKTTETAETTETADAEDVKKAAVTGDIAPWPVIKAADVVGRDEAGVTALLGPPDVTWEKPPARVWRYVSDECILATSFYLDVNDQTFRALSLAAEKVGGGDYAAERCLARIVARQSARK